jgi:probable HAF family extracellular repeat protein
VSAFAGRSFAEGRGIDPAGSVVGRSDFATGWRAFRWAEGVGFTDLGTLGGTAAKRTPSTRAARSPAPRRSGWILLAAGERRCGPAEQDQQNELDARRSVAWDLALCGRSAA